MKIPLRKFEHNGETYEIYLIKRQDGTCFIKDFKKGIPFSPFYCNIDEKLNILDIGKVESLLRKPTLATMVERPIVKFLIDESEDCARHWADNKHVLGIK